MGVASQIVIQQDSYTLNYCNRLHIVLTGAYNLHIFLAIFYMYHLKIRIEDPTSRKIVREVVFFLALWIPAILLSIGSHSFNCAFINEFEDFSKSDLTFYA